ncbi:lipoate--protein ligase family protein [Actinomadura rugatobispora]|uniref:Biotin/lipoate A/B protein ligase family protein n=1 Tax=Actinomadura rugatobispora TaxID=1994 RepID=A0ABW1A604_9ACTN|nr:lipoate--protein ligase family protein [Actinomadura rugatobispora]
MVLVVSVVPVGGGRAVLSVIVDDTGDPAWNLALDEALARSGSLALPDADADGATGPVALFRIWQNAPSVVVGRFQDVDRAVDVAGCAQDGVRVVRRASGGEAVYTGPGTLNFTLVQAVGPGPDSGSSVGLGALVAKAVERFGVSAAALWNGTVQTARLRTRHAELVHAAVHVVPAGPGTRRYIACARRAGPPPALGDLGADVPLDTVAAAVLNTVADEFGILRARRPNALERACRDYLFAARYSDVTWHLMGGAGPSSQARACTGR